MRISNKKCVGGGEREDNFQQKKIYKKKSDMEI